MVHCDYSWRDTIGQWGNKMKKLRAGFFNCQLWLTNQIKSFKWTKIKYSWKNFTFFLRKNLGLLLVSVFKSLKIYIYVFIIPLILLFVVFAYQTYGGANQPLPPIVAGYLLIPGFGLILGINNLIAEWKASVFLKRINLLGTSKAQFLLSIWIVGYMLGLLSTIICGALVTLFAYALTETNPFIEMFAFLNYGTASEVAGAWLGLFLGVSTVILSSIGLATLIAGAFHSIALIQSLGVLVIAFTFVFSDLFLNPAMLASVKGLVILGYFVPQKYSAWTVFYAVSAGNLDYFLPNPGSNKVTISFLSITWPIINSLLYCAGLFLFSLITFKWNNRG